MFRIASARQQAIDETKRHGNPQNAIALAIVYLADVIAARKDGLTN